MPLNCLMVRADGPQTIADLRGKKIGYSVSGVEEALELVGLARHSRQRGATSPAPVSGQHPMLSA